MTRRPKQSDDHAEGRRSAFQQNSSTHTARRHDGDRGAQPLVASWAPALDRGSDDEFLDDEFTDDDEFGDGEFGDGEFGDGEFGGGEFGNARLGEANPGKGADGRVRGRVSRRHRKRRGYGWGIYTVPLLIVITALAVYQAVNPSSDNRANDGDGGLLPQGEADGPVVRESPGQTFDPDIFSAELPEGGDFPISGGRTFHVLPGSSDKVGSGTLYTYTVEAEVGVDLAEGNDTFGHLVQETLSDPRSWTNSAGDGVALQRTDDQSVTPDFRVTLVSRDTARELCEYSDGLPYDTSCRVGDRVYLNVARYVRGAVSFEGDIGSYRRYAINHEVGHVFGNPHVPCGRQGGLAPVMMQQTLSTSNNELHKLNEHVSQGTEIPENGFVCKYNAWPFPAPSNAHPG